MAVVKKHLHHVPAPPSRQRSALSAHSVAAERTVCIVGESPSGGGAGLKAGCTAATGSGLGGRAASLSAHRRGAVRAPSARGGTPQSRTHAHTGLRGARGSGPGGVSVVLRDVVGAARRCAAAGGGGGD